MKRILFISVFLFSALALSFAEGKLNLTYRMLKGSRTFETLLASDEVSMKVLVRETNDGIFSVESPPFFILDIKDLVHIGEIHEAGILSVMLDPFSDADLSKGFTKGGNIKETDSPSVSPKFSGVVVSLQNLDIISLSPVLNPNSPYAFGLVAGTETAFAGVMHAGTNELELRSLEDKMQIDWRRTCAGRNMVFSIDRKSVV